MRLVIALFFLSLFGAKLSAQIENEDIIANYLYTTLTSHSVDLQFWDEAGGGGYIFEFELDVLGNGKPVVFLSTSLRMERFDAYWNCYFLAENGKYLPFDTPVYLTTTPLTAESKTHGLDLYNISRPFKDADPAMESLEKRNQFEFTQYQFDSPKIKRSNVIISADNMESYKAEHNLTAENIIIKAMLISDFVDFPRWRLVNFNGKSAGEKFNFDIDGFFHLGEDKMSRQSPNSFTANYAIDLLKKMTLEGSALGQIASVHPSPSNESYFSTLDLNRIVLLACLTIFVFLGALFWQRKK